VVEKKRIVMKSGCLILLLLLTAPVQAQHSLSVPLSLERAVNENSPEWKLIVVNVRKTRAENNTSFRWKREDQEVAVFVNEYDSVEETHITPQSLLTQAARKQERIRDLGDEAYLLSAAQYGTPRFDIIFRKGKVRADVEAPSAALAEQFAKQLAAALPPVK
jgi:hypothetical protein